MYHIILSLKSILKNFDFFLMRKKLSLSVRSACSTWFSFRHPRTHTSAVFNLSGHRLQCIFLAQMDDKLLSLLLLLFINEVRLSYFSQ